MSSQVKTAKIDNAAASGDYQVVAGVANKIIRVLNYVIIPSATVGVTWKDGNASPQTQTAISGNMKVTTQGLWPGWVNRGVAGWTEGHFDTSPGNDLTLTTDAGTQVSGYLNYVLMEY